MSEQENNATILPYEPPHKSGNIQYEWFPNRVVITVRPALSHLIRRFTLTTLAWVAICGYLIFLCLSALKNALNVPGVGTAHRELLMALAGGAMATGCTGIVLAMYHRMMVTIRFDARADGLAVARIGPFGRSRFGRRKEKLAWIGVVVANEATADERATAPVYAMEVRWVSGNRRGTEHFLEGCDRDELIGIVRALGTILGVPSGLELGCA